MERQAREYSDEINFYDLWKVIAKRRGLITGFVIVATMSTAIVSFVMPKIYKGEAVLLVQPAVNITARDIVDFVGNIDAEKKAKLLPNTRASISKIRLDAFKDSKDKISVFIEARNTKDIQPALSEIIGYINDIDLVRLNVKEEQERLTKRSAELSTVIEASSELLHTYQSLLKGGKLVPVGFNPVELNKRISDIKLEKLGVDQAIQRLKGGLELAKQIDINNRPVKPRIIMNIALSALTSLLFSVFFVFFLENYEKTKKENSA